MINKQRALWCPLMVAGAVMVVDQLSKAWAFALRDAELVLNNYLSIVFELNRGISWSMLQAESSSSTLLLTGMIFVVILLFSYHTYQLYGEGQSLLGPALILAGAVSNLIDRCRYGGVVDFIMLHYHEHVWPIFNVADVAICVGALLLLATYRSHGASGAAAI